MDIDFPLSSNIRRWHETPFLLAGVLALAGCTQTLQVPDLGGLYNRSAQDHDAYRNPVIVIPGILGSQLEDRASGTTVWGAFGGGNPNPHSPDGARLTALPLTKGASLRQSRDEVHSVGVLDNLELNLLGLPVRLRAYAHILASLGAGGYRDEELGLAGAIDYGDSHFTCFQFHYDWRRDNVENAQLLHDFILEKREYVRAEIKKRFGVDNPSVKFDIIAHSMGGLITRYFLRYGNADLPADGSLPEVTWAGTRYVDRVAMVGTPNAGSAEAIRQLVNGIRFAPIFHKHEAAILGTFPSIYQLLPRTRHAALRESSKDGTVLDVYSPELWKRRKWGLADPEQDWILAYLLPGVESAEERRAIALEHQRRCLDRARQFAEALDAPAAPPQPVRLYLVAGDAVPTLATLAVDPATGEIEAVAEAPGDGTVLRTSALMDERVGGEWTYGLVSPITWYQVQFLFSDHLGMTMDPSFTDNILYMLLEDPR